MDKNAIWKWLILAALLIFSMMLVIPPDKIKLGLDLRGGASFTVEIDEEDLYRQLREEYRDETESGIRAMLPKKVKAAQEQALEIIRNRVDALGIAEPIIYPEHDNRIAVQIPGSSAEDQKRAADLIRSAAYLEFSMVHENNDALVRDLMDKGLAPEGFRLVSMDFEGSRGEYYQRLRTEPESLKEDWRAKIADFKAPPGYRFMLEEKMLHGHKLYIPYFVKKRAELKGDSVQNAKVEYSGQFGQPYVALKFDAKGSRRFAAVTSEHAPGGVRNPSLEGRRYLGIIMDGRLYSAPFIKTAIHGGEAVIEGNFTPKDAQDLAIVLRAGSLPAPVKIVESRLVDPSLGKDSINSGMRAAILAGIAVAVFMLIYYFQGGVIVNLGLLNNMLLLPLTMAITAGVLGMFSGSHGSLTLPVLTLPGIAGIILTIGMAVDANVLIFERIREEQNLGKLLGPSVEAGYSKAFLAILDSNLTTAMAAVLLFIFGTGPVRGFGITLTAGIIASMYSALVVTRMIFDVMIRRGRTKPLKMLNMFRAQKINFLGFYKIAVLLSVLVVVLSVAGLGIKIKSGKSRVLGTDFTGGAALTYGFIDKLEVAEIRDTLTRAGVRDVQIQYQKELDGSSEHLFLQADSGSAELIKQTVGEQFENAGYKLQSEDVVGPQIGSELLSRAAKAVIFSFIGMVLYISWRFRFAFALGGIAALLHDIVICVSVYCLLGRQINMTMIAGLMTIIGYSINDTIVIFDRIREKLQIQPSLADKKATFKELCNRSLNETFNRTILTSLTTFLSAIILLIFGGGAITDFALIMSVGIIAGTYSSIYIATPVMLQFYRHAKQATPLVAGKKKAGAPAKAYK